MKRLLFLTPLFFSTLLLSNQENVNDLVKKEEILFNINKIYQIEKINKIKKYDEYVCNFGKIDIIKNKFEISFNLNDKTSMLFDEQSYRYYLNHQSDIHNALKQFFEANINGNYCTPNENLIYDNPNDKPITLEKTAIKNNKFNGFVITTNSKF